MPRMIDDGCVVVAEPGCSRADALACTLKERGMWPTYVRATAQTALDALLDTCRNRTGLDGLVAFHPLNAAALALAIQRRVDRLVLLCDGRRVVEGAAPGQRWFVHRNLPLCDADLLCVDPVPGEMRRLVRILPRRAEAIQATCSDAEQLECEFSVKYRICDFLLRGSPRNSLAENAEMCIIYR